MSIGTVFEFNSTQVVRLPADARFPEGVKKVNVRVQGKERIVSPIQNAWDNFFLDGPVVTNDFMEERVGQEQAPREAL